MRGFEGNSTKKIHVTAISVALLIALPWLCWGAVQALKSNNNDPRQWLPRGFDEADKYGWFQEHFGRDEITVVSWPGCTLDDDRVDKLAAALTEDNGPGWFARAVTGPQLVRKLVDGAIGISRSTAIQRLQGTLIGRDAQTTCVVLIISEKGAEDRVAAVEHVIATAEQHCGLSPDELRLGGPTVDAATIDTESERLLLEFAGLSAVIAFLIMWQRLRQLRLALIVLTGAIYATGLSLAILYYTGGSMNLVMTMLPPLVYVLSVSAAVHVVNYYRDAIDETGLDTAPAKCLHYGWRPCALAAATTAVGLLSLATSTIQPVKMFGIYSAAAMVASLAVTLLFLPVAFSLWPARPRDPRTDRAPWWRRIWGSRSAAAAGLGDGSPDSACPDTSPKRKRETEHESPSLALRASAEHGVTESPGPCAIGASDGGTGARTQPTIPRTMWTDRMAAFICRWHAPLTVLSFLMVLGMAAGLYFLRSTVRLQYRFGSQSRIIHDYRWLEENLGPLVPLEVVVHFDTDQGPDFLAKMQTISAIQNRLEEMEHVGATMSAADFAPPVPVDSSARGAGRRAVLRRQLLKNRDVFVNAHFLSDTSPAADGGREELWRVSVRAPALSNVDYGRFTSDLKARVDPMLEDLPGVRATYTGVIPLIYKAQRELLRDLAESFLWAFAVIAVVMMVALRSIRAGLLAMAPNIFPAVVIFGLMGWTNVWVEIGSVMTASAALGIAVDDTFHFLTWFRRGTRQGMSRHEALRFAYGRCAGAMLLTTLICSAGLIVFTLSSFMPIVRFALMMASLLMAAIVGDLVFLPAILAGPLGRLFEARKKSVVEKS